MKPKSKALFSTSALPTHVVLSFGLAVAGLGVQSAQAADKAWSTTPTNALFSGTNWTAGQVPGASATTVATTDSLFFGSSTRTSLVNDNNAFSYAGLTFNSGAAAFNILGNSFTLSGDITNSSSNLQTISTPIALSATQSINTTAGDVRLNGVISGATFGLTKATAGTLTLTGVNTYTGANTFSGGGTVVMGLDTNLGATAATVALSGTTLKANLGASIIDTHVVTVTGANTINVISPLITNFTYSFNTAASLGGSGALTVTGNGSLDVSGQNAGILVLNNATAASGFTGTLTMQSGGLLELNVNGALPSAITVALNGNGGLSVNTAITAMASNVTVTNAGNVLNFGNGNAGVVTGGVTLNSDLTIGLRDWFNWATARSGAINGIISGAGGLTAIAPNTSTLTLGAANTYTGATSLLNTGLTLTANATSSISASSGLSLSNSILTASYASGIVDKFKDAGNLSIRNNSSIALTGNAADTTETIGVLELAGGNSTITLTTTGTAVTTLAASSLNRTNVGTGLIIGSSLGGQTTSVSKISLTTPPSGANLVGAGGAPAGTGSITNLGIVPWLAGNPSTSQSAGREFVTYDTSAPLNSLRTLQASEYDAAGTIAGAAAGTNVKSATTSETGLGSVTLNALLLAPTATQTITGTGGATLTLSSGALMSAVAAGNTGSTAFSSTISGFDAVAFGNGEAVIRPAQSTSNIIINSPISVTAGGGLTKTGPGTLTLGAVNTYTGPTNICQTTLATTVNNVFNGTTGAPMVLSNNAQLNVNATTQKITTLTLNGSGNGGGSVIGAGGTLDLGGDVAYETSVTNPNAGVTLSVSNMNLNGNRVFNVGDASVVTGAEMTVSSIIADGSASSSLTKTGAGTMVLSGANTYGGGTTISGGTLQIGAGATAGSITGNVVNNGTLTFNRSDALPFGSVSGTGDLFQAGAGTTTLAGTAISTGKVIVRAGTLSVPALNGTGAIEIGSGATAVGLTYTGTGENTSRALTLTGTTGGVTLTQNGTGLLKFTSDLTAAVSGAKTLTLQGSTAGTGELAGNIVNSANGATTVVKVGTSTWTLSGTGSIHSGGTRANAGTLIISGSVYNAGSFVSVNNVGATNATLKVVPGAILGMNDFNMAEAANSRAAIFQSGGAITVNNNAGIAFKLGSGTDSYGYYNMSGGTLDLAGAAGEFNVGGGAGAGQSAVGVMDVSGGAITAKSWILIGRGDAGTNVSTSSGLLNITGGTISHTSNQIGMGWAEASGATSIINVGGGSGAAALTGYNTVTVSGTTGIDLARTSIAGQLGAVNLLTNGTLTVSNVQAGGALTETLLNFNGGTLKATATNAGTGFLTAANLDGAYVYGAGGTVDNNGTNITVSKALLTTAGSGITTIAVTDGGAGYIGAPLVEISGGTGATATAYANMVDDGTGNGTYKIGSITVTSAGVYSASPTTVTLTGGGASTAATIGAITTAANATTGGMTFQGAGITTLSGANTYTGTTTVAAGTLAVNGSALPNSGKLVITSGKVDTNSANPDEVVETLYFGATQKEAGLWGSTSSSAPVGHQDDTRFSGTGVISVTTGGGGSAYAAWALSKGLDGSNNGATQDNGDFDGVANALEFVLGGDPKASDPLILPDPSQDATNFYFTFNRADESEAEIGLTFQYGSDLIGWTDVAVGATTGTSGPGVAVTEDSPSPTVDTVVVTVPKTSAVGAKLFGRLKAVK